MRASGAHHAARTQPLPVRYLGQRRVQAVDVVGGRAGVTAQQLPSVFTHSAELHVVVLLLACCLFLLLILVFGLPLDPLLLLCVCLRGEGGDTHLVKDATPSKFILHSRPDLLFVVIVIFFSC